MSKSKEDEAGESPTSQGIDSENASVDKHPWPYLAPIFTFCAASGKAYKFKCLLCAPKVTECAAYINSPSNLKKHIECVHPAHLDEYNKLVAGCRKRKAGTAEGTPSKKKLKQSSISGLLSNANKNSNDSTLQ